MIIFYKNISEKISSYPKKFNFNLERNGFNRN